jgi:endogenous inhibitor of DNA gyrase (YacG/DUF329 family)
MSAELVSPAPKRALLFGTVPIVHEWLDKHWKLRQIDLGERLSDFVTKGAAQTMAKAGASDLQHHHLVGLLDELYAAIHSNWANAPNRKGGPKSGPTKNWRWKLCPNFTGAVWKRDEVELERHLAAMCIREAADDRWANQIPTSSGFCGPTSGRTANIDLAHWAEDSRRLTIVEMKANTSNPPNTAFQLICYALLMLLARRESTILVADPRWRAEEQNIVLKVFAPEEFYYGFSLDWFERALNKALPVFDGHFVEFSFRSFPDPRWRPKTSDDVLLRLNTSYPWA